MRPLVLAFAQLNDPACSGVLWRSVLLTLATVVALLALSMWGIGLLLADYHWPRWLAEIVGTLGVVLLAWWLFLPAAMLIATLFIERIAAAVDRRHYPDAPPPRPAPIVVQVWDGLALAAQILVLNLAALLLALLPVPGLGLVLALLVSGWAIGRGLFVAVAMRRVSRMDAIALYRGHRLSVLVPGAALAAAALVPGLNLVVPIVGTAAMVHVLNSALGWRPAVGNAGL